MSRLCLTLAVIAATGAAGCGEVDTAGLPSLEGYTGWHRVDNTGAIPGHGDTYRIIYVNEIGRGWGGEGNYPPGTVIVKEIRDRDGDQPGDLQYVALMRRLGEAPAGGELEGGWLFTLASQVGDAERHSGTCWRNCHVQAPFQGTWLDYGR